MHLVQSQVQRKVILTSKLNCLQGISMDGLACYLYSVHVGIYSLNAYRFCGGLMRINAFLF